MRRGKFLGLSLAAMLAIANMGMTVTAEEAAVAQSTVSDNAVLEIDTEEVASEKIAPPQEITINGVTLSGSEDNYTLTKYTGSATTVDLTQGEFTGYKITSIDSYAFQDCKTITKVVMQDSIKSIGDGAFDGCTALSTCAIPNTVESIGEKAFRNTSLTSVTIPASCNSIGKEAFYSVTKLQTVKFDERTENLSVGTAVFSRCSQLQSVKLPAQHMTSIPENFFYDTELTSISIPADCTQIGKYAFYKTNIKEVLIPKSVKSIGEYAFEECTSLKTVTFADGFTMLSIGASAFKNAAALTVIDIPDVVETISDNTFYGCKKLVSVELPAGCASIGEGAFRECETLKEITIPASCTSIGNYAFYDDDNLEKVTFLNPDTVLSKYVFHSNQTVYLVAETGAVAEYAAGDANLHHWRPSKSLVVNSLPAKTSYLYGEKFVIDGLAITANFSSQAAPISAIVALDDCIITGYDSRKVGTQAITVEYGNVKTTFNVKVGYDLSKAYMTTTNVTYTASPVNTTLSVKGYEMYVELKEGVDYTVQYVGDHTNVGTGTVEIIGKGYYTGSQTATFEITPKAFSSIRDLVVKADNVEYTGKECKTKVTVSYGSIVISPNDYTVEYENNKNVGTATITIIAKNNYIGTAQGTFKVTRKSIKNATVKLDKSSYAYTTKAIKPKLTVTLDGKELVNGTDYSVSYENNIKVGKGVITIKGKNNYKDTFTKKFTIKVKKGTTFTIGSYKYKVTDEKKKEVEFKALAKSSVKDVKIPATVKIAGTNYKVTSVAEKALYKKTTVKSVSIGSNVTKIGASAFSGCKNLKKITVQGDKLKSVGKNAIKGVHKDFVLKVPKKKLSAYKKLFKNAMGTKKEFKTTKL